MKESIKKFLEFNGKTIYFTALDGQYWIALKPICEALGVNYKRQYERIKRDEILSRVSPIQGIVGKDGRLRKMVCLPEKYLYGWLFSIRSTSPEMEEYREKCYNVLLNYFRGMVLNQEIHLKKRHFAQERIKELQAQLLADQPLYKELIEMKRAVRQANYELGQINALHVQDQLEIWESDELFDPLSN